MAQKLNLKTSWIDDETIRVSWDDIAPLPIHKGWEYRIAAGALLIIVLYGAVTGIFWPAHGNTIISITGWITFFLGSYAAVRPYPKPNEIDIGRKEIFHEGWVFETASVTRFEYGFRSDLTGDRRLDPPDGQQPSPIDPIIIRLWKNDRSAYVLAMNTWETQVNHEIRDTLANALEAVRNLGKQEAHEAEFGKSSGDFGVPDY